MMAHDLRKGPIKTEILLTHTHWDHITGFPFFTPIYVPGTELKIYGPVTYEDETLEKIVGGQLAYRYFPVRQAELASKIEYFDLKESRMDFNDGITITTKYLNHPILCIGYRFEYHGKIVCTAYETEPFRNVFCHHPNDPHTMSKRTRGGGVSGEENQRGRRVLSVRICFIHDAQYTRQD
jgi:phosphoribosyl 1,2-cyclic phosphodiesterase